MSEQEIIKPKSKRISESEIEEFRRLHIEQGLNTVQIAKLTGRGAATVERKLKKLGVFKSATRRKRVPAMTVERKQDIISRYEAGSTCLEIAEALGVSDGYILKNLKSWGVNTSFPHRADVTSAVKHLDYFENIDTEAKAYLLGFIIADGNVTLPSGRNAPVFQFEIQEKDVEILELFCSEIGYDYSRIKTYARVKKTGTFTTVKVTVNNSTFCKHLATWGVAPRKAYDVKLPAVGAELQRHMLRGLYDGDGAVTDTKVELFGNKTVVDEVHSYLIDTVGVEPTAIYRHDQPPHPKTGYSVCRVAVYQKEERMKVMQHLYGNCEHSLSRKAEYNNF